MYQVGLTGVSAIHSLCVTFGKKTEMRVVLFCKSSLCYHLFFYFSILNFFQSLLQRFCFQRSLAIIVSYCTLFLIFKL